MFTPPVELATVLAPFATLFTRPSWRRAQALFCGVLLAPANGVLTAALRVLGLSADTHFQNYHRVLNRARWSAHHAAGILLRLLVRAFVPAGPVVIGLDDTVERRRGAKIAGRSMYRDAVRSSWGCFQKTSGLRWIGLHLITRIPWAKRTWALPFLTALAPSGNYPAYVQANRPHKPLSERARGLIGQAQRWLPGRELIVVTDGGLRRARSARLVPTTCQTGDHDQPPADGRRALPARPAAPSRTEGSPPGQRSEAADAQRVPGLLPDQMDAGAGELVRRRATLGGGRRRHGGVVAGRQAAGRYPLGAGA